MPLEELTIGEDHMYQEYPMKILDTSEKVTRNNRYRMCKVQWSPHNEEEATWEKENSLISFPMCTNLGGKIHPKGVRFVTP
jgi:hypothetical protein